MESLGIIARESGGSVRDALSLLDQVVSCAQGSIEHEQVLGILGVVDRKMIFDMSGAVIDRNMEKILTIIDDIYSRGQEIKKLYNDLTEHFRNLLVASMGGDAAKNINLPAYEISLLLEQARNCPPPWISMILDKLFEGEAHIRYASNPRLALEMVFFKIHQVKPALPIEALIHKLDLLQKQAEKNSGRPAEIHGGSVTPQSDSEMPRQMVHDAHVPDTGKAIPAQGSAVQNTYQAVDLNDTGVAESVSPGTSVFSRFNPDDSLEKNWQNFLVSFKKDAPSLAPILSKSVLKNISGQSIEIEVRTNPFNISRIKDNKNTGIIDNSLTQFFGRNVVSAIETITDTSDSSKQRSIRNEKLKKEAIENPVIAEAIRQFGGKVEIKILEGDKK
jgi:DNA polymerase-3 subunit gamma/tau